MSSLNLSNSICKTWFAQHDQLDLIYSAWFAQHDLLNMISSTWFHNLLMIYEQTTSILNDYIIHDPYISVYISYNEETTYIGCSAFAIHIITKLVVSSRATISLDYHWWARWALIKFYTWYIMYITVHRKLLS